MIYPLSTEPSKNKSNHAESSKHTARGEVEAANKLREFVRYGSPGSWLEYGEELRDAAEVLWGAEQEGLRVDMRLDSDHSIKQSAVVSAISRPYLLLAGSSLENILKGLIVAREPRHVTDGVLSKELKMHNVRLLFCAKVRSFWR